MSHSPTAAAPARTILGHPDSLFMLFFTEMWERFSYYGMRSLLTLFLIATAGRGGWGWSRADAADLYGWYTFAVYLTPIVGGAVADRLLGTRRSIMIGGLAIAAGHFSLFLGTVPSFYAGLALITLGTGLFKPNISAVVGQLYTSDNEAGRDGGYTLFYMGVNSGSFFGTLLCGYLGEKLGWNYGFGLAGLFMLLGALQFYFGQSILGGIGLEPAAGAAPRDTGRTADLAEAHVVRDRLLVVGLLSFFTIFFWFAFEQAGGSMTIFAADYTDRVLSGPSGVIFNVVNSLMTLIPLAILTGLLVKMWRIQPAHQRVANLLLTAALALVWGLVLWMLAREFGADQTQVPATWFGVLNAFFIVVLAPLFSRLWERWWNPSAPVKFGTGLVLVGLGFAALAYGASGIAPGARTAQVSMVFLVLAYLFHTMGELCLSPVGLSYVSKLVPTRLLGLMFGLWYFFTSLGNKLAGLTGSYIDAIAKAYSLAGFFLIFTLVPIGAGLVLYALNRWIVRRMHGVH
ncbi:MAG: peptide MFS transporter [Pelomonas sp.]|nr:peptide MFS transporter [Roseateles sp.]